MIAAVYLAERTYTPVPYWIELPLREFLNWIETVNEREENGHGGQ